MDKLYIPNPKKWMKFYNDLVDGKIKPQDTNRGLQVGGNLGRRQVGGGMITIDNYLPQETDKIKDVKLTMVSPAQQIVRQAEAELKREGHNIKRLESTDKSIYHSTPHKKARAATIKKKPKRANKSKRNNKQVPPHKKTF